MRDYGPKSLPSSRITYSAEHWRAIGKNLDSSGALAARSFLVIAREAQDRPNLAALAITKTSLAAAVGRSVRTVRRHWKRFSLFLAELGPRRIALKLTPSRQYFAFPSQFVDKLLELPSNALRVAWRLVPWLAVIASKGEKWVSVSSRQGGKLTKMQPSRWGRGLRLLEQAGFVTIRRAGHFKTWIKVQCPLNPASHGDAAAALSPATQAPSTPRPLSPAELRSVVLDGHQPFADAPGHQLSALCKQLGDRVVAAAILKAEAPALTSSAILAPAAWLSAMLRSRRDDCRESWTAETYTPSDGARYYGRSPPVTEDVSEEEGRTRCRGCNEANKPLTQMFEGFVSVSDFMLEWARSAMDHEPSEGAHEDHGSRAAKYLADIQYLEDTFKRDSLHGR